VKPTRSANRIETSRRSATDAGCAAPTAVRVATGRSAASDEPHSPQNFCPGGFVAPHEEQIAASAVPHSPQKFCVAGFSAPQFEHVVTVEKSLIHDSPSENTIEGLPAHQECSATNSGNSCESASAPQDGTDRRRPPSRAAVRRPRAAGVEVAREKAVLVGRLTKSLKIAYGASRTRTGGSWVRSISGWGRERTNADS
jgi:hypothetical protein